MIIHYLKTAIRNLLKYKLQSVISMVGLAIGIAFFIFSLYWLRYETSYDSFYPVSNRTYMIFLQEKGGSSGICPSAMIPFVQEKCPEVETITRMDGNSGFDFATEEKELKHPDFRMIDSLFLKCFPQKVIYGAAPARDNEILLSESFARKYWKRPQDAIGSLLTQETPPGFYIPNPLQLHVCGIMADAPTNSSFQYEGYCLKNYENSDYHNKENWIYIGDTYVHLVLKEGVRLKDFSQRLLALLHEMEELKNVEFSIIPLYQKHFEFAAAESFSYSSIRMFTAASLLLLCCVLFNFINLFLNRYYHRLREMKLRKSLGANHRSLIGQLLTEVLLHCLLAGIVCGCLLEVFTPFFEHILSTTIQYATIWREYLQVLSAFILVTMLLLLLPVWQIVHVSVSRTLTSKPHTHRSTLFRKMALVVQLIICLFFLASTAVLYRQIHFMRNTDLGFDSRHLIELLVNPMKQNGLDMLEEIKRLPMIQAHATTSFYMISSKVNNFNSSIEWEGKTEEDKKTQIATLEMSKGGEAIFNSRLLEGRMFAEEDWTANSDSPKDAVTGKPALNKVLITQKMADLMRTDDPIGKIIRIPTILFQGGPKTYYTDYEVIGKEIAVRKIMGANVREIIGMFFREYIGMVCMAAMVAFPCVYAVMHRWLEQYAYHISIGMDVFIVWLGVVTMLVLLTILQQVIQAARQNPAEVIKSE